MENPPCNSSEPIVAPNPEDNCNLVVTILEALLATLHSTCAAKTYVSLVGKIQGKHPGLKALTTWARETLHLSLALLSLKANNMFEVTFTLLEDKIHTLTQTELTYKMATISFSSWCPHFNSNTLHVVVRLPNLGSNSRPMPSTQGRHLPQNNRGTCWTCNNDKQFGSLQSQNLRAKNPHICS